MSTYWSKRHRVVLPTGPRKGFGLMKGRWYISYQVDGKLEREFIDVDTEEQAIEARDRRYLELLLSGQATRRGDRKPREPRKVRVKAPEDINRCIQEMKFEVIRYKLIIGRKYYGMFKSIMKARARRDEILEQLAIKPCLICGRKPVLIERRVSKFKLVHDDCPNAVKLDRIGRAEMLEKWNTKLYKGETKGENSTAQAPPDSGTKNT